MQVKLLAAILAVPRARWPLLAEAGLCLAAAAAAIAFLPFARVGRLASGKGRDLALPKEDRPLDEVRWALDAVSRRVPFRAKCFERGLAAQWMLQRRGIASTLYYGAALRPERGLAAHVWVRAGGTDVMGCENAADFTAIAQFPPRSEDQTLRPS